MLALVAACGPSSNDNAATSPTPSPTATAGVCTTSGAAVNWPSADQLPSTPAITSVALNGDVLTMTFQQGTPAFDVAEQPDTVFHKDPSGAALTLKGTAGVKVTLRGFRGDVKNNTGPSQFTGSGTSVAEIVEVGDSEGVVTWGVGANGATCATVTASGSTLTFHFVPQPIG